MSYWESGKSNEKVMGKLDPVLRFIQESRPPKLDYGEAMNLHETVDDLQCFMKASMEGMSESDSLWAECHDEVFRGAAFVLDITILLERRLRQYSKQESHCRLDREKKAGHPKDACKKEVAS